MSHVVSVKVKILDVDAFDAAVRRLGGTLHRGQKEARWYGRSYAGRGEGRDMGRCAHVASFPNCTYDVGLVAEENGAYRLAFDPFSSGGLSRALGGDTLPLLTQAYSTEKMRVEAERAGYTIDSEERMADGSIRLRILAEARY